MNPERNYIQGKAHGTAEDKEKQLSQQTRIPFGYKEAMHFIPKKLDDYSQSSTSYVPPIKKTKGPITFKWKSSFKTVGQAAEGADDGAEEGPSEEIISSSQKKKDELYNPYDPASSDSEAEMPQAQNQNKSKPAEDQEERSWSLAQRSSRWDSSVLRPGSRPLPRLDFGTEKNPNESEDLSPGQGLLDQQVYRPEHESVEPTVYGSIRTPPNHRVCSPDRLMPGSSRQQYPASYPGKMTNGEERMTVPEYRRDVSPEYRQRISPVSENRQEMTTTVRLSSPRLKRDYLDQREYTESRCSRDMDQIDSPDKMTRLVNKNIEMDTNAISCNLCDVEFASAQELEDHLESKSHWDTLEHIQRENNYNDVIIAFLHDFMLYKSRQCSRAIDDCALPALRENDHMTKMELFQCAACKVFVSTSASSVQTHITSKEHLINTKEFEAQQRHTSLDTAETMMKLLKPQFDYFLQGGNPFE